MEAMILAAKTREMNLYDRQMCLKNKKPKKIQDIF